MIYRGFADLNNKLGYMGILQYNNRLTVHHLIYIYNNYTPSPGLDHTGLTLGNVAESRRATKTKHRLNARFEF